MAATGLQQFEHKAFWDSFLHSKCGTFQKCHVLPCTRAGSLMLLVLQLQPDFPLIAVIAILEAK